MRNQPRIVIPNHFSKSAQDAVGPNERFLSREHQNRWLHGAETAEEKKHREEIERKNQIARKKNRQGIGTR